MLHAGPIKFYQAPNGSVTSTDSHLKIMIAKIEASLPSLSTMNTCESALSYVSSLLAIQFGNTSL